MRDILRTTLLCWETKNWRHQKKAKEWCKNYGLISLTKTVYIGNLNTRERKRIENYFNNIFVTKTEKYYLFPLHISTIQLITDKKNETKKKLDRLPAFEII